MTDTTTTTTTEAATRTPLETVQALYAAFGAGDMGGLLALIDEDVDWSVEIDAPGAERVPMFRNGRGHDAVLHYFGGVAELDWHHFEPLELYADGDRVLVRLRLAFTHRGTGRSAELDEVHRFEVRDGRVVHYRPYADTAAIIEAFRP